MYPRRFLRTGKHNGFAFFVNVREINETVEFSVELSGG